MIQVVVSKLRRGRIEVRVKVRQPLNIQGRMIQVTLEISALG